MVYLKQRESRRKREETKGKLEDDWPPAQSLKPPWSSMWRRVFRGRANGSAQWNLIIFLGGIEV